MSMTKIVIGGFAMAGAIAAFWIIGTADNPVRDARVQGRLVSHELIFSRGGRSEPTQTPLERFAGSLTEPIPATETMRGRVYVPAYSNMRLGSGRAQVDLSTTLSIHNSSSHSPIILRKVGYYGTDGRLVEALLEQPVGLNPLATIEFFIAANDIRGGSGANFLVEWTSSIAVSNPVIEAVMIGTIGAVGYSFVSHGRDLQVAVAE